MRDVSIGFTSITSASNQRVATRGTKMLLEKQDFTVVIRRLEETQGLWYCSALVFRNRDQMDFVQRSAVSFILVFTLLDVVFMFPCCDEVLSPESSSAAFSASNSEPHPPDLASDNCLCCARIVLTREFTLTSSDCVRMTADARGIILMDAPPEPHFHPPRPA
jgi:hypothetical protein